MRQLTINQALRLGVEAARAGLAGLAQGHFRTVLKQDPDNIPALLWLAYLAPTPEQSLRLLNEVLAVDPHNQRAWLAIEQIQRQLPGQLPETDQAVQSLPDLLPPETARSSRRSYLVGTLLIVLVVAILGLVAWSNPAIVIPSDTLTPWLPVSNALAGFEPGLELLPKPDNISFISVSDTIIPRPIPQRVEPDLAKSVLSLDQVTVGNILPSLSEKESKQLFEPITIEPVSIPGSTVLIGSDQPIDPDPVDPALLYYKPAYPGEKWIEVNVSTQEVTAWEGNVPVIYFKASTGLPETPTVFGKFRIYWKLKKTDMFGFNYHVPDVPYTMYFYGDYALHGTYWHNNFGHQMSRGCVNLSIDNARRLFDWAGPVIPSGESDVWADEDNPGTLVVVHP